MAVFSTAARRNRVATRASALAADNGFVPSGRVAGYPPGVTSFSYTAPPGSDEPGVVGGSSYPAVQVSYEHTDQQLIAQAELLIQEEINTQGWLTGTFGTWTDVSG